MSWFLRLAFLFVLATMLCATSWARWQGALWKTPHEVVGHPWFIATRFDCYSGFLTFYAWLCDKASGWLIAILLLGSMAMSSYMLITLHRLPADARIAQVWPRQKSQP